jgi:ornithine cyclodeaminase/alanine dehydrogenase-like protein (mu-crystallin family)
MLILTSNELRLLLTMRDCIAAVEDAFRDLARGEAFAPERLRLVLPNGEGELLEMPAYMNSALGTKIVSVFPGNAKLGLDAVQAAYMLLNATTGQPLALMEGRFITAIRTAATSAVATKHLVLPGPKRLGIFGAGVQARFHIEAMMETVEVERLLISSRTEAKAAELADWATATYGVACRQTGAGEAAGQSDLICTCTGSPVPLFDGALIRAGTHINAVGAFTPDTRELGGELIRRARVIIDSESAAGREAGDLLIPLREGMIGPSHFAVTLSDVVSQKMAGRTSNDEITIFKSCGLAIEDLATAHLAYSKAVERGAGTSIDL